MHVRVGAANAGHTVYTKDKKPGDERVREWNKHVLQQLPCAAYANPAALLVLGAGALISPEILQAEITANEGWREEQGYSRLRLLIDWRAHVVLDWHKEKEATLDLDTTIGSTSHIAKEGIGVAQSRRALRSGFMIAEEYFKAVPLQMVLGHHSILDTVTYLHDFAAGTEVSYTDILLEGTQGTSLSNTTGFYPYVTSRCTSAPGLLADCGLPKADEVIMVCRCHPIRVAGNSGPFWNDSKEITWAELGINSEKERTTVTKKVRRVATFSHAQVAYNAKINGATSIALTFADYVWADIAERDGKFVREHVVEWPKLSGMISEIERRTGIPVKYVGTGPHSVIERVGVASDSAAA